MPAAAAAPTKIHNQAALPATIVFSGADPDSSSVPGNVTGTISFRTTGGEINRNWRVQVQSLSGNTFANCPRSIPVSSIRVTCASATADGGTAACAAPFNLSSTLQTLASGMEGSGNAKPYTINVNFVFEDSWQFIATNTACSVSLSYQILAD